MVDLNSLFTLGQRLATDAVRTSGTRVRVEVVERTTVPVTLERVENSEVLGEHPAIVSIITPRDLEPLPGVEVKVGDWKVTMLPTVTAPPAGVEVVVVRCRDRNLLGGRARVLGHRVTSAGAVLTVFARPLPPGPVAA